MTLKQYLASNSLSQAEFARRLGVSEAVISRYCTGLMVPRKARMLLIERATEGAVTPGSWFVEQDRGAAA